MASLFCVIHVSEPAFDPSIANCDFEESLCRYYQEQIGGSVWNRVSVKPNVYRIGDHTTGTGAHVRLFFHYFLKCVKYHKKKLKFYLNPHIVRYCCLSGVVENSL